MTPEEKDIIFNQLLELEERHPAFAENVRDNAYCEAVADVKRIIERINETSLPSNPDEAAEEYSRKKAVKYYGNTFYAFKAGAEWMAEQGVSLSHLMAWYIQSVDAHEPVWTKEHLEELVKDYILIPKN